MAKYLHPIAKLRKDKGLSQRGMYKLSGIWNPTISKIESGKTGVVNYKTATSISKVLGISTKEFYDLCRNFHKNKKIYLIG